MKYLFPAGAFTAIIATGMTAGAATIYVSSQSNGTVNSFDALTGNFNATIASNLNTPTGLALDPSGNLYIAETETGKIWKYNPSAGTTTIFGDTTQGPSGLAHLAPFGIAIDSNGNVWVDGLDHGGTGYLDEFSSAGGAPVSSQSLPSGSLGRGMVFDSLGNLFIAASGNDAIYEMVNGSNTITTYTTTGLADPRYVAMWNGVLYVSNTGSGIHGGYISSYSTPNSPALVASSLGGPNGAALAGDGQTLFFSEYFSQDVVRCTGFSFETCNTMVWNTNNIISGANGLACDLNMTVSPESVQSPEPATLGLIAAGLALFACVCRRT